MNGWMDRYVHGWVDGWTDEEMNCKFQDGRAQTFPLNGWKPPPSPSSPCFSSFLSLFSRLLPPLRVTPIIFPGAYCGSGLYQRLTCIIALVLAATRGAGLKAPWM